MTQRINDKLKKCCELCQSHLDKPCAWLSLGNEYCDTIMEMQNELNMQNEIIELMAEQLTTPVHNKNWVINYFEEKVKSKNII